MTNFWKAVADGLREDAASRERPAEPGDFRFEIEDLSLDPEFDDYEGGRYSVRVIDDQGLVLERFRTDDPGSEVEAAREAQCIPFEERMQMYAERGW
jgi:hypothetical protein